MNLQSTEMLPESYLKCPCQNCGGNVEFPAEGLGQTIGCPHCGGETKLVRSVDAPVATRSPKRSPLLFVLIPIALAGAVAIGLFAAKEKSALAPQVKTPPIEIRSETKAGETSKKARRKKKSATKPDPKWNGLLPSEVALEKSGGRLVYAVGTIRNDSNRQRFGVTVELALFDATDTKLGESSDYTSVIEPQQEWKFKALVTDPKAVTAEITAIKEN